MQGIRFDGRRKTINSILFLGLIVFLILIDQIIKTYFRNLSLNNGWSGQNIIDNFFYLGYTANRGASFGSFSDKPWAQTFFTVLTIVALTFFFCYYIYICKKGYVFLRVAVLLIICGTIGNFIDRIAYGEVVDFIGFIFGTYYFPLFNFADSYLTIGIIMLCIHYLFLDDNSVFGKHDKKRV